MSMCRMKMRRIEQNGVICAKIEGGKLMYGVEVLVDERGKDAGIPGCESK